MVLLQLSREPERPRATREIDLVTGNTIRMASGDKSASQAVMALAVLGSLEYEQAVTALEKTALNDHEDADVRWEAVRQCLARDARTGMCLLANLASRKGDALSGPARALNTDLNQREAA